jgi:hypothetical protein
LTVRRATRPRWRRRSPGCRTTRSCARLGEERATVLERFDVERNARLLIERFGRRLHEAPRFWGSAFSVVYTYLLFPLLVAVRAWLRPGRARTPSRRRSRSCSPPDEAAAIGRRLENLLACDYPAELREIIVASDGSTDGTAAAAASFADRGVTLLALGRVGKADALNAAVARATGEILVFTDANTAFATDALRELVRPFADPEVGGVAGDQRYLPRGGDATATGERRYWDLDRRIKALESRAGSTVSATGAIYAIRRELFEPVRTGVTDDFFTSTAVVAAGRRLVSRSARPPSSHPLPPAVSSSGARRGSSPAACAGVGARRALLDPRRHGFYSLQLLSTGPAPGRRPAAPGPARERRPALAGGRVCHLAALAPGRRLRGRHDRPAVPRSSVGPAQADRPAGVLHPGQRGRPQGPRRPGPGRRIDRWQPRRGRARRTGRAMRTRRAMQTWRSSAERTGGRRAAAGGTA